MNQATRITKETVENCLERANHLRQEGRLDEAIDVYQRAIELDPNSYISYHYRGEVLAQKDDLSAAASFYLLALEINPDYCWSYHCLGLVLFWQGKYDEAISSARKALKIEPKRAIFHYHLGLYLEHKLELDSAINSYSKALGLEPNLTEARNHLEAVLKQQAESPQTKGSKDFTVEQDRVGIDLKTLLSQGKVLMDKGDLKGAILVFQQGIELDANSYECYHFLGEALTKENELEKAEKCYRQAIEINPDYCWSYHCLGQVLCWQDKLDEAIDASRKALELNQNNSCFYRQLGQSLKKKGEIQEASKFYQKAFEIQSDVPNLSIDLGKKKVGNKLEFSVIHNNVKLSIITASCQCIIGKIIASSLALLPEFRLFVQITTSDKKFQLNLYPTLTTREENHGYSPKKYLFKVDIPQDLIDATAKYLIVTVYDSYTDNILYKDSFETGLFKRTCGFIDGSSEDIIWGWAWNPQAPNSSVTIDINPKGTSDLPTKIIANRYRKDLHQAGFGDGCHGFEIPWYNPANVLSINKLLIDGIYEVKNLEKFQEQLTISTKSINVPPVILMTNDRITLR